MTEIKPNAPHWDTDKNLGYKGMSGFIVDSNLEGVELGKKEENMGSLSTRGWPANRATAASPP